MQRNYRVSIAKVKLECCNSPREEINELGKGFRAGWLKSKTKQAGMNQDIPRRLRMEILVALPSSSQKGENRFLTWYMTKCIPFCRKDGPILTQLCDSPVLAILKLMSCRLGKNTATPHDISHLLEQRCQLLRRMITQAIDISHDDPSTGALE